ncbi:putative cytosolic 5'-nucleotidase 3-like [Capsicum annuum]|nr:putative cytosolic 5'-nucleotidase 3-like [Capsicum annuum]
MSCSPLLSSKKYEDKIIVNCLKGFNFLLNEKMGVQDFDRLRVEIKWKGSSKGISLNLGSFNRRSVKKNFTKEECLKEDEGIVEWNDEFLSVCNFSGWKYGVFQPWEVVFTVINGTSKGPNQKVPVLSFATLNLADFASVAGDKQEGIEIFVPLEVSVGSFKNCLSLCLMLNLVELRNAHEASETFPKFIMSAPVSPNPGKALLIDSQNYEAPVYANHAGGSFCSNTSGSSSDEDLVHYIHHISDTKHKYPKDRTAANQSVEQSSKRSLLSWRKRKLSFKYPKTKGEPLLKKHYGEDGGDDIDFDRRQLCPSDESSSRGHKSEETSLISVSEFGDEIFVVGSWEQKEIISRDGQMKLQTPIFFASIDQ